MQTLEGLNELIINRLIEKNGDVKLSENNDIVSYGNALGITENQLLFKILDLSATIDWTEMENGSNSRSHFQSNSIICKNCNSPNEIGVANFCVECGSELNPKPRTEPQIPYWQNEPGAFEPETTKKSNTLLIIVLSAVALLIVAIGIYYFNNKNQSENFDANQEVAIDTTAVAVDTTAVNYDTVAVDSQESIPEINLNKEDVSNKMIKYYSDMSNDNFDATNYYRESVLQYITRKNITSNEINTINRQNHEYLNGNSSITNNELTLERTENNINYYSYWVDYNCFRKSKNKYQYCTIKVEVGFDYNEKIVSYKELGIQNLRFEETDTENETEVAE